MIRDEAHPLRFYAVRHWTDAAAAAASHADPEVQTLTARTLSASHASRTSSTARGRPIRCA